MVEKVTRMLIKVDLQCCKCHRKIKKVLCKFPQIRDQIYDEKQNTVLITVVCCSPEKIKDKICCKAGNIILGIEIIPDKPIEKPPPSKRNENPPGLKTAPPPEPAAKKRPEPCHLMAFPVPVYPPVYPMCCCRPCYRGYGPCYCGHGGPLPMCSDGCGRPVSECQGWNLPMCSDGCGRPVYECQGGSLNYSISPCNYFNEENASGCTVM